MSLSSERENAGVGCAARDEAGVHGAEGGGGVVVVVVAVLEVVVVAMQVARGGEGAL